MIENKKIHVTQPTLPPLNKFIKYLEKIWEKKYITNNGEYHQQFQKEICRFLVANNCSLCVNGTIALMVGLKALGITGEVITTPFSFVATANAIKWTGGIPVFCDIEKDTYNIDPEKIESLITSKTTAILPVHVYGNPCDVKRIREIAEEHDLKIIYDAAHAFNTRINNETILNHGDLSVLSFHATKVFNTIEGGAVFSKNTELKNKIDSLINFGFSNAESIEVPGLNAKMNEIQAAYGLILLQTIDKEIEKRRNIANYYNNKFKHIYGIKILPNIKGVTHGNPYYPILINNEKFGRSRDDIYLKLKKQDIHTKKYFYPLISHYKPYKDLSTSNSKKLPVAEEVAKKILCLPMYSDLKKEDAQRITKLVIGG